MLATKFVVIDNSDYPQQATARVFDHHLDLLNYLTEYGIKHKKFYRIDKELVFQLNPSLA